MHILLKSSDNYKGIIVITHKEISFLDKFLENISEHYNILIHYGFDVPIVEKSYISYNLVVNSKCTKSNRIPYVSRHFLPLCFNTDYCLSDVNQKIKKILNDNNIKFKINIDEKNFDFIIVTRAVEMKNSLDLLTYVTKMNNSNNNLKFCYILLEQDTKRDYYKKIIQYWDKNKFDNLCFIDTHFAKHKNVYFKGLSSEDVSLFYKTSKIYMHACEKEGGSKTIHEALCCGCKILAKKNMIGGGLDLLNNENSLLYNRSNVYDKMSSILLSYDNYKIDKNLIEQLNETYTVDKFLKLLHTNLNYNIDFNEFKNLANVNRMSIALPGHKLDVEWYCKDKLTADVLEKKQLDIVKKHI
tara:strand:- start:3853 stop:4920 length:1068 start_codon:yes stop_codon:yes gene_type:complete